MTIYVGFIAVFLTIFSFPGYLQNPSEEVKFQDMKTKVLRALDGKEAGWKAMEHGPNGPKCIISTYRNKNEYITFSVTENRDIGEAKDWHDKGRWTTSGGIFKSMSGIGDEAYIVTSEVTGSASLRLRVDKFTLNVNAPSEELATKFAKHLIKEFTGK